MSEIKTYQQNGVVTGIQIGGMLFSPLARLEEFLATLTTDRVRLTAERDRLLTFASKVAYCGEALIRREYEPGSRTVQDLVDEARSLISDR